MRRAVQVLMSQVLVGIAFAASMGAAQAQVDYPSKPVRIICDSAPGSATDVTARIVAEPVAQTLPGFFAGGWNVMLAPLGTAPLHMRKVGFDLHRVLDEPQVKEKLAALGAYVQPMTPAEMVDFINAQKNVWKPVAEAVAKEATK